MIIIFFLSNRLIYYISDIWLEGKLKRKLKRKLKLKNRQDLSRYVLIHPDGSRYDQICIQIIKIRNIHLDTEIPPRDTPKR